MKSKFLFGLVAVMVVLALAPSSFAQVQLQIFPQGSSQEIQTNRNAQTGDPTSSGAGLLISGSVLAASPLTTTSLFIDYPGIMTSSTAIPAADPVRLEGASGMFSLATISSINYGTGVVEIVLPGTVGSGGPIAGTAPFAAGSMRLVGVRLDVNGLTAPVSAAFSLGSNSNNYILNTQAGTVINALGKGIASLAIGSRSSSVASTGSSFTILTTRTVAGAGTMSFTITEGFASAWRTSSQSTTQSLAGSTTNPTQIKLTFTGLQSGITLTLTTSGTTGLVAPLSSTTINSTANTATVSFTTTSLTTTEAIQFNVTAAATATGSNFTASTIAVTATMAPISTTALSGSLIPDTTAGYPAFAQADEGPLTLGAVVAPTTTMLVPYAVSDGGFDTGLAIANTTSDPFGGVATGGATAGSGALTITLYGRTATGATPTAVTVTTSTTVRPGAGLDASGNLASGSTWTALLSEVLKAAGQTGSFTGYLFIQAPFLNAHGSAFVSDFRSFTSASPVLVLAPPTTTGRSTLSVETLGR